MLLSASDGFDIRRRPGGFRISKSGFELEISIRNDRPSDVVCRDDRLPEGVVQLDRSSQLSWDAVARCVRLFYRSVEELEERLQAFKDLSPLTDVSYATTAVVIETGAAQLKMILFWPIDFAWPRQETDVHIEFACPTPVGSSMALEVLNDTPALFSVLRLRIGTVHAIRMILNRLQ